MLPVDLRILEVPDISVASHFHRDRIKRKNKRARAQLLLVSSELNAAAVAELADQDRRRVVAARAASDDRAAVLALADHERLLAGCPVPAATADDTKEIEADQPPGLGVHPPARNLRRRFSAPN